MKPQRKPVVEIPHDRLMFRKEEMNMDEFLETYVDEVMGKQVYRSGIFSRPSLMGRLRRRFATK